MGIYYFKVKQSDGKAPGTDEEIHNFCVLKYNTTFKQFSKIEVNGGKAEPLYKFLKSQIQDDVITGTKNERSCSFFSNLQAC